MAGKYALQTSAKVSVGPLTAGLGHGGIRDDEFHKGRAALKSERGMARHLYQCGDRVEVLEPDGLRALVAQYQRKDFPALP
jgi:predicted DNA-binding transcriptional regulator YafY